MNYIFSEFEYMPDYEEVFDHFQSEVLKINNVDDSSGVYQIYVPMILYKYLGRFSKLELPKVVFLPHFKGFHDLETHLRTCPGSIAVQVVRSKSLSRSDFASVVKCVINPIV